MSNPWYYSVAGSNERLGPVSDAELRAMVADGRLTTDSLIWKEGMAEWVPASSAKGLFPQQAGPPPIPQSPPPLPPAQSPPEPPPVAPSSRLHEGPSGHGQARSGGPRPSRARSRAHPGQEGEQWSGVHMALLVIGAIIVPFVGIIAGIIGLTKKPKKIQGGILLAIGVVMLLVYVGGASTQRGGHSGGSGYYSTPASSCSNCGGSGFVPGKCYMCFGSGWIGGRIRCKVCGGTGGQPCPICNDRQ